MEKKELIKQYFKTKYPNERYVMKNISRIADLFGNSGNNLYIIEFIDSKMKHPATMELRVKEHELLNTAICWR